MTVINLEPGYEKRLRSNPIEGMVHPPHPLLYHQLRTYEELLKYDLVCNTYNTGTGKTIAALLHLFRLNGTGKQVLFIAPTNALLQQHADDIRQFVAENDLDFHVRRVTAAEVRGLRSDLRSGEILQRLIKNYLEFEPGATRRKPLILVVNPDIFYYALFFQYGAWDQRNVFHKFMDAFDYIVIDEFHYYDSKQLANFLFFFVICQQFGYFDVRDRKICLLSATPNPQVLEYLDRVFGEHWTLIAPGNEPAESADHPQTQTLSPLTLTIVEGEIQTWVQRHRDDLSAWLSHRQDGAIISSALWRVNEVHRRLRTTFSTETQMRRITGPEPEAKRAEATRCPLILATPTVDIGYNFAKENKRRQNLDFVVCDARFGDELLQRIGRAGRLLGKTELDHVSHGVAVLPAPAANALAEYDGQTLSRSRFADIVNNEVEALPPKHTLYAYIRSHAILESFYPLDKLFYTMREDLHDELRQLYERVRDVFAPSSKKPLRTLRAFFDKYRHRQQWLRDVKDDKIEPDGRTAEMVSDWLAWEEPNRPSPDPGAVLPYLSRMLRSEERRSALVNFVQEQVALTQSLFNFRDSFQGPTAVVHDPRQLLSSEPVNAYDLFHLLTYYHITLFEGRQQFNREAGETDLKGDFYVYLRDPREEPLYLSLAYDTDLTPEEFAEKRCRCPVALRGFRLVADEPLDASVNQALADQYVTALIVRDEDRGVMIGRLRGTNLYSRRLTVTYPDGQTDECSVLLGTAAFHAHAELQGYFWMKDRLKEECIII